MGLVPPFTVAIHRRNDTSEIVTFLSLDAACDYSALQAAHRATKLTTIRDKRGVLVGGATFEGRSIDSTS